MRRAYSTQPLLGSVPIGRVDLNFHCRDSIIPVLRALQGLYSKPDVTARIMKLIENDVNSETRKDRGREGMQFWHIIVLMGVRLGCDLTYDQLHDLAENHRQLRAIMGISDWDDKSAFNWRTIRNNICLVKPSTVDAINQIIIGEGHAIDPTAIETVRADSFVMETNIHYPTESSLIRDGLRKIIENCVSLAHIHRLGGWRQHQYLLDNVKRRARNIDRIASRKGPNYVKRLEKEYRELLQEARRIVERASELCRQLHEPMPTRLDIFGPNTLQAFIARTEQVMETARRRILNGETVPNSDKLFSMFEPHTQLYKRGKAGEPIQFGRQVLIFEDDAGFIVQSKLMRRDEVDSAVAIAATKELQKTYHNRVKKLSFDRGFHSPANQKELAEIIPQLCLPKPGAKQSTKQLADADEDFLEARLNHAGVESAIGALQSGNGMERCRDRSETGFERYLSLAILGRNLRTLGRLLIAQDAPKSNAAFSKRKAA